MNRLLKNATIFILIVLIALSFYTWSGRGDAVTQLNYTEFKSNVEQGLIKEVNIAAETEAGRYTITGYLANGTAFKTITFPDSSIAGFLTEYGVIIN